ncbi:MAG: histidinol-phosphatase HisJ family protein [Thermoanaerobaculia bacterium]
MKIPEARWPPRPEPIIVAVKGLPDYHVHTFRCGHAGGSSRDFVLRAIDRGLAEIAFTDHIPLYFLPEADRDPKLAMREDQFEGYVREVEALGEEFAGRIAVRLGIEADYAEGREDELGRWLSRADWDLVLGSVHWVAGGWIDDPDSSPRRFASEGTERLYDEYYRLLARAARTGYFDVLTHFDLPKKFGHRPEAPRTGAERGAIAAAKEAGCAAEISSAGLRKPVAEAYPEPRLLREIVAAGIPVTFASDAHAPAEVGWGFERTLELARGAGAGEYVTFAKRRKTAHPLP